MDVKRSLDSAAVLFEQSLQLSKKLNHQNYLFQSQLGLCELEYVRGDPSQSMACFESVIEKIRAKGDRLLEARTWHRIGQLMWRYNTSNRPAYPEILEYYNKALAITDQLSPAAGLESALIRASVADLYMCEGKLDQAYQEMLVLLEIFKSHDYNNIHHLYYLLAVTNRLKGDLHTALAYAIKSVENSELNNETFQISHYLATVGDIYRELDEPGESIKWYERALHEWEFNFSMGRNSAVQYRYLHYLCKDLVKIGEVTLALNKVLEFEQDYPAEKLEQKALLAATKAIVYQAIGKYEIAEKNFLMSLGHFMEMGDAAWPIYISELNQELGSSYYIRGNYENAKTHLLKALSFPSGVTSMSKRREIYLSLFQTDSALRNYPSAIRHYQYYKATNDSIFNENKSRQIQELQVQYDLAKKESEIATLQNERTIQTAKLNQANNAKNYIIGILLLFLVIIGLLLYSYTLKQKSNRLLISQKNEIYQKNISLQNLLEDKEWLLKEVHHRVKNNLQVVMSLLNSQSNFLESEDAYRAIKNSQHRLYAISLIHQKLYKTDEMDVINMKSYIDDLASYIRDSFSNRGSVTIKTIVDTIQMDTARAVPVGLILNEAITNSFKYGFPNGKRGSIVITMKSHKDEYLLAVEDNGTGFPAGLDPQDASTLGLSLIRGLCKQLNATISIKSRKGVQIALRFRVEEKASRFVGEYSDHILNT